MQFSDRPLRLEDSAFAPSAFLVHPATSPGPPFATELPPRRHFCSRSCRSTTTAEISRRRTLRRTVHWLVPGTTLLGVLLIASIGLRSVPVLLFAVLFLYGSGVIPIAGMIAIAVIYIFYWRRNWL